MCEAEDAECWAVEEGKKGVEREARKKDGWEERGNRKKERKCGVVLKGVGVAPPKKKKMFYCGFQFPNFAG